MMSAQAAPNHGLAQELMTMLAMMAVRNALSAASNTVNGLSRMRILMAFGREEDDEKRGHGDRHHQGVVKPREINGGNPAALNPAPSPAAVAGMKNRGGNGHKRAGGDEALILCSMVSATSKGFFNTAGMATPAESFTKQAATSNRAGTQNHGLANHGSLAFCSGVLAWKYCQAPTHRRP